MLRTSRIPLAALIASAIAGVPTGGSAATVLYYGFQSAYTPEAAPEVAGTEFYGGPALTQITIVEDDGQTPPAWSGNNWVTSNEASDALASNSYASFQVTPEVDIAMTILSIAFDVRPHGSGPDAYLVTVTDIGSGFTTQMGGELAHSDQTIFDPGRKPWQTLLASSDTLLNLTGTQEIRIYGYSAAQANRELLLDNIKLSGTFSAAPEPSLVSLIALSGLALANLRRIRKGGD